MTVLAVVSNLSIKVDPTGCRSQITQFSFLILNLASTKSQFGDWARLYRNSIRLANTRPCTDLYTDKEHVVSFASIAREKNKISRLVSRLKSVLTGSKQIPTGQQWKKTNKFLRQRREKRSAISVPWRHYCFLLPVALHLFTWNSGYKNIIGCFRTPRHSVIR